MLLAVLSMPVWLEPAWQLTWMLRAGCLICCTVWKRRLRSVCADAAHPSLWLLHGDVTQPLDKARLISGQGSSSSPSSGPITVATGVQDLSLEATEAQAVSSSIESNAVNTEHGSDPPQHQVRCPEGHEQLSADYHTAQALHSSQANGQEGGVDGHNRAAEQQERAAAKLSHDMAQACKPADVICAFNFSVCLLHQRSHVQVWQLCRPGSDFSLCHGPNTAAGMHRSFK